MVQSPTLPDLVNPERRSTSLGVMKALVFEGPQKIAVRDVPIPKAGYGEVVIQVTLTTICGTDLHILHGEYPVRRGLIIGHEPVGRIHERSEEHTSELQSLA